MEQQLAKQSVRHGQPLPDRIANAPKLRLGLNLYLMAFFELDSERSHSFGYSRIPWSSVRQYAMMHEFDEDQTEALHFYTRQMDAANAERAEQRKEK